MKNKNIYIYALSVLILAGIIVFLLKGFNTSMMIKRHDTIEYTIGKKIDISEIKQLGKDVFKDKKIVIKTIEVFDDSISLSAENITEEEKEEFINKINEKYNVEQTEKKETEIISVPQLKLRQFVKPYIIPTIISFVLIYIVYIVRFYKVILEKWKEIIKSIGLLFLINLAILSIVLVIRIPVNTMLIPLLIMASLLSVIIFFEKQI